MKKICHNCEKTIPNRLNYVKEPTHYFMLVCKDKEDYLYWCNRDCLFSESEGQETISID